MSLSFKKFNELTVRDLTEEELLNELFGIFKNNERAEAEKKRLLALKAKQAQALKAAEEAKKKAKAAKDALWKKAKDEADNENGGYDPKERGSVSMRSQQARGRAAENDWVQGMLGKA